MSVTTSTASYLEEERMAHLKLANEIRRNRAAVKREIRSGVRPIRDVVMEPEWFLLSMPVYELLVLAPRFGRSRVGRALRLSGVWPLREVGELTARQRRRLVDALEGRPCSDDWSVLAPGESR